MKSSAILLNVCVRLEMVYCNFNNLKQYNVIRHGLKNLKQFCFSKSLTKISQSVMIVLN